MLDEFREESVQPRRRSPSGADAVSSTCTSPHGSSSSASGGAGRTQDDWRQWGPSVSADVVTPCFRGGFLYRLFNEARSTWSFYNDTYTFEMHCTFTFEQGIPVTVLCPRVAVEELSDGKMRYAIVVYPMETVEVLRAKHGHHREHFDGKALTTEYLTAEMEDAQMEVARGEARLWALTRSQCAEEVLEVCKTHRVSFIDPEFPPSTASLLPPSVAGGSPAVPLSNNSAALLRPCAWRRPEDYLPLHCRQQLRLFRNPIAPPVAQRGDLGDSWVISAIAALCENSKYVRDMFRHPVDGHETALEEAVGARRVLLNKDGLWQSTLVDTYLPMKGRQPRFARCAADFCEVWVAYLEKAYAKRNNSYSNIISGDPLFALRDFTGFPTTRLDAKFRACRSDAAASAALFTRLAVDCDNGHQVLLSTPLSGESALSVADLKAQGILVGYAYTVLEMVSLSDGTRLLKVRNPWAPCTSWRGDWAADSPRWTVQPETAKAMPVHDGSDNAIVLSWEEVLTYFIGCGVVFSHYDYADYRIPSSFSYAHSQLCLEVSVTESTQLTFVLSQEDRRTRPDPDTGEYAPLVLSVAATVPGTGIAKPLSPFDRTTNNGSDLSTIIRNNEEDHASDAVEETNNKSNSGSGSGTGRLALETNSTADTENPTSGLVFLQGRDVSLMHTFLPECSPYLIIPRRLVSDGDPEELPFVLGVLSQLPFTSFGQAHVRLRQLPPGSPFFDNFVSFPNTTEEVRTTFQVRKNAASLAVVTGTQLNPEDEANLVLF